MSRRSGRKVNTVPSFTESGVISKPTAAERIEKSSPNKKALRAIKNEQSEITTESITSQAVLIEQSNSADIIERAVETVAVSKVETSPKKRKIKKEVDATDIDNKKSVAADSTQSPKKAKVKRKAESDEEANQELDSKKLKKKRKTKEEKEAEAMPLAARTSIQSLKKSIYIGAHVSGAGGKHLCLTHQYVA